MKKPVYSLKPGDQFANAPMNFWTVDEVIEPEGWRSSGQVNEEPKSFVIIASCEMIKKRKFYLSGFKLVAIK